MPTPDVRPSGLVERLEKSSIPEPNSGCFLWLGGVDAKGRGRIWVGEKLKLAHRAMWESEIGPIPEGKMLCHRCDNAGCVNTVHMYVGTHADNMRDMKLRRRYFEAKEPERVREIASRLGSSNTWCRGEANATAKLTAEQAASIRIDPRASRAIAKEYGVNATTIQRIKSRKLWP